MTQKIKIIFTLSFLFNIILIGFLLGTMYSKKTKYPMKNMDSEVHAILKSSMDINRKKMRENHKNIEDNKKELREIMIASEFNRSDFDKKMTEILLIKSNIEIVKANVFGDTLSKLSQEDRKSISNNLLRKLSKKPHKPKNK